MDIFALMDVWCEEKNPFFFMIDFQKKSPFIFPLKDLSTNPSIAIDFPDFKSKNFSFQKKEIILEKKPISYEVYKKQFEAIKKNIYLGNSYLTNLTCETPISTIYDLETIYKSAVSRYKLFYQNEFICFSPEPFIQIKNDKISTFPMKGTIDASIENAEEILLSNAKEKAEHYTVVDLLRNDLSKVAENVKVKKFRYIEKIKTKEGELLQASSEISGSLMNKYKKNYGSIMKELLPAGSISGAPKDKTIEMILRTETHNRRFYTGVMGVFDGENLDSSVMIRFIENRDGKLYFKSGGGITHKSNLEEEYKEMIQKIYVPIS